MSDTQPKEKNEVTTTETPPIEQVDEAIEPTTTEVAVVEQQPPEVARANEAIDRAAAEALESPLERSEVLTLAMTAKMLCMSGAAPKLVQNNPHIAFHIAMVGRDLGISPSMAMNLIDVIPGSGSNPPTLSLSPQLRAAQVERTGAGEIRPIIQKPDRAVWIAIRKGGELDFRCAPLYPEHHVECTCHGILGYSEFTWSMAIVAGLVDARCLPGTHWKSSGSSCSCKHNWKTYDFRMCSWRACGYCADDFFPQAAVGLYSPDELGALVDEKGKAIDVSSVEVPDGFEPKQVGSGASEQPFADSDDLYRLQLRIWGLPDDEKADLKAKWKQADKLSGVGVYRLSPAGYRLAQSIVAGLEKKAKSRVGYNVADAVLAAERELATKIVVALTWFPSNGLDSPPDGSERTETPGGDDPASDTSEAAVDADSAATPSSDDDAADEAVAEAAGAEAVDAEIERVKTMKPADVKTACEVRGLQLDGNTDKLRHRLTIALLKERVAAAQTKPVEN